VVPGTYDLFPRYLLPLAPFLCLAAACGFVGAGMLSDRKPWHLALALLLAVIAGHETLRCAGFDHWISQTDTRARARAWLEANVPPGSVVSLGTYHYNPQFESLIDHLAFRAGQRESLWGDHAANAHTEWKSGILSMLRGRQRKEDPFEIRYYTSSRLPAEEALFNGETQYVTVSEFTRDRYYSVAAEQFDIDPSGRRLYDRIAREGVPLAVIEPPPGFAWFDFTRMRERYSHPKIEIYRIDGASDQAVAYNRGSISPGG
jgi:hypothetical protein